MSHPNRLRAAAAATLRQRRAAPRCRGGASSLLRLGQPVAPRLPSTHEVGDWIQRAFSVLAPMAAPSFAPSDFNAN
jgi:hypothetical protein